MGIDWSPSRLWHDINWIWDRLAGNNADLPWNTRPGDTPLGTIGGGGATPAPKPTRALPTTPYKPPTPGGASGFAGLYGQFNSLLPRPYISSEGQMSLQEYQDATNPAFSQALAGVTNRFRQAYAEIDRREKVGQELLGMLPGRIDTQFGEGKEQVGTFAEQAGEIPEGYALPISLEQGGYSDTGTAAPFMHALETLQSERQADVPLLGAAQSQLLGQQRTDVSAAEADAIAQIQAQRNAQIADFMARSQDAQLQHNAAIAQAEMARQQQILELMSPYIEQQVGQQAAFAQYGGPEGALNYFNAGPGSREIDPQHGQVIQELDPSTAARYRDSSQYATLRSFAMEQINAGVEGPAVMLAIQEEARKRNWPKIGSLVMYDLASLAGGG